MSEQAQNLFDDKDELSVESLIGEGKKYATPDDALKSVPHAQKHIQSLERQVEELRQELQEKLTLEQVLQKIEGNQSKDPDTGNDPDIATAVKSAAAEELPKLFKSMLTEHAAEQNVASVQDELVRRYGTGEKAKEALANKARELGVEVSDLRLMAQRSPKAVLAYFPSTSGNQASQGSVNTAALRDTGGERNYAYYQKLRRENPTMYFDKKTQIAMERDAMEARRAGRNFYE
jgi:hypothetical protein